MAVYLAVGATNVPDACRPLPPAAHAKKAISSLAYAAGCFGQNTFTCCSTLEQAFGKFLSMSRWVWTCVVKSKVALSYALRPTECCVWSRPKSHSHHPQKTKKRPKIKLPPGTQRDARPLIHPPGVMGQYGISRWSRIGAPMYYFVNGKLPLLLGDQNARIRQNIGDVDVVDSEPSTAR